MLSSCGREYLCLLSLFRASYPEVQHGDFLVGIQPYVFHCFRRNRSNARGYRMASDSRFYLLVHHDFLGGQAKRRPLVHVTLRAWKQGLAKITPGTVCACCGENKSPQLDENQTLCGFG